MKLVTLAIKDIFPSPDNPRVVDQSDPDFVELLESVKAIGVVQPVQVREHPKRKGKFELLAGQRRLAAAQGAKRTEIPALDHGRMADDQAFRITFIENTYRKDLKLIEQGNAAAIALDKCGGDATAAGLIVGQTAHWVSMRADANLHKSWASAVMNVDFSQWTAAHLAILARLPAEVQERFFRQRSSYPWSVCESWAVADLERRCAEELMTLAKAPFETGEGSKCHGCPKRSSAQPLLWGEIAEHAGSYKDRCLDRKCWEKRETKAAKVDLRDKRAKYEGLRCISTADRFNIDPQAVKRKYGRDVLYPDDYKIVTKKTKGAVPALVVAGRDKNKVRYVKVATSLRQAAVGGAAPKAYKPSAKQLAEQREDERLGKVTERFDQQLAERLFSDMTPVGICLLAQIYGVYGLGRIDVAELCQPFEKHAAKGPAAALSFCLEGLWEATQLTIRDGQGPVPNIKDLRTIGKAVGIDPDPLYAEVVAEEQAEPTPESNSSSGEQGKDAKG